MASPAIDGPTDDRSVSAAGRPIAAPSDVAFEIKDAEVRQFRSLTASLCLAQTLVISYAFGSDAKPRSR